MLNNSDFFQELENTRPFLKMAFEGFAGTGKTYTASQLAVGIHRYIKSDKPIAVYDTERAFKALKKFFDKEKIKVIKRESRSLADLTKTIDLCEKGASDILIIDSITHVWESYVEAYRSEKRRTFIQFQDWGILKPKWKKEFSDRLVQSKLHIIFTGRAGFEYDNELNEETGKKELVKTGIKMKVENETEYEPDIVVLMERTKEIIDKELKVSRRATILKDRSQEIDGKIFFNPSYEDFKPAIESFLDGEYKEHLIIEQADTFKTYEDEHNRRKNEREILLEETQGIITQLFPGQSANEKKLKVDILEKVFGTRSWRAVETTPLTELKNNVGRLQYFAPLAKNYLKKCREEEVPFDESILIGFADSLNQNAETFL